MSAKLAKLCEVLNAHTPDGQPLVIMADEESIMVRGVWENTDVELIPATVSAVATWLGY